MSRFQAGMLFAALLSAGASALGAEEAGRIEGVVTTEGGAGVGGVSVELEPTERTAVTDSAGAFVFARVPAGTYSIAFRLADFEAAASGVLVAAGEVTRLERTFEGDFSFAETVTVESVSLRRERLVEAPAAVTNVGAREIALRGGAGQIPTLLQHTVGAELTQNGLYDFNFNSRGMNAVHSRRIQTLVDGRDFAIPETSSQEWWTIAALWNELATIELVRGPSSALYGPNSVNGVLSLTTKAPRDSQGGALRLTLGELQTLMTDLRWAGGLGDDWYLKALANHTESETFARSRVESVEYEGLPQEVSPLAPGGIDFDSGMLRLDKYAAGGLVSLEAGASKGGGETFVNPVGRAQTPSVKRSWARFAYDAQHWSLGGYYNDRAGGEQLSLSAGVSLFTDSRNYRLELRGNRQLAGGRLRLVGGVSYGEETIDSADPGGVQTVFLEPINAEEQAAFGQLDVDLRDNLKLVVAARWDDGTLHDAQLSPKAALVYAPADRHTLRLGFNRAFQVGNYTEIFLNTPAGPPVDLSPVEAALAPFLGGVALGLGAVPVHAFGNTDLDVEEIRSLDLGYRGVLSSRLFLTVDYYRSSMKNFISDLLFGINPAYPPYRAPAELPPEIAAIVEQTLLGLIPGLTNDPTGAPQIVLSNANTGRARSQGVEVALSYEPRQRWLLSFTYSWFDLELKEQTAGATINANAPENKASFALSYRGDKLAAELGARWVEAFDWSSGIWVGPVPSYTLTSLDLSYRFSDRWEIGLNVSNALDEVHYEVFGGDLLERRAVGHVSFTW